MLPLPDGTVSVGDLAHAAGYYSGFGVPAPTPEPEPTPAPTPSTVRPGTGQNILEMGWYEDKPWIKARDKKVAKDMRDAAQDVEEDRKKKHRRRIEAIAVAMMMLR